MKITPIILFGSLLASASVQSAEAQEVAVTAKDLSRHLGIKTFKWKHHFEKPFDSVDIKILYYAPDKAGVLQKHVVYHSKSSAGISATSKDGPGKIGTSFVTFMVDKNHYSFSLFGSTHHSSNQWKEFSFSYIGKPVLMDGEYIFMATWKDNTSTDRKQDMLSYVAMSIEAQSE